jgi:hypothetical protein
MLNEVIMHECVVRLMTPPDGASWPDEESLGESFFGLSLL